MSETIPEDTGEIGHRIAAAAKARGDWDFHTFHALVADVERAILSERDRATAALIPRLENCGRYMAQDNKGNWHYLNHANTWQAYEGPILIEREKATAAERAECAKIADERAAICADAVAKIEAGELYAGIPTARATEDCARMEAQHIARLIRRDPGAIRNPMEGRG